MRIHPIVPLMFGSISLTANTVLGATVIIEDSVENQEDWIHVSAGYWSSSTKGLTPQEGATLRAFRNESDWKPAGIYKDFSTIIGAGNYTYTFEIGDLQDTQFIGMDDDRIAIGFFDPSFSASATTDARTMRNAIHDLKTVDGVTFSENSKIEPTDGWLTWSFSLNISEDSSSIGTPVYFGFAAITNSADAFKGVAFDSLNVNFESAVVPEPWLCSLILPGIVLAWTVRRKRDKFRFIQGITDSSLR